MKILFIINTNVFFESSASSNRWRTMIEGLAGEGPEIHLFITQGYKSITEFRKFGFSGKLNQINYYYGNIQLNQNIWLKRINRYLLRKTYLVINKIRARNLIKKIKPEFVFLKPGIEVYELYNTVFPAKPTSFKLAIELNEYNDIQYDHNTNKLQDNIVNKQNTLFRKRILPEMDLFFVMTKNLISHYQNLANNPNARFFHLPMTVDLNRFRFEKQNLTHKAKEKYLAYCGSSSFLKDGVDIMIHAFNQVVAFYPEINLKIAAFWENDGGKMMELIRTSKFRENIEYLGALNREEIPSFLQNATLLLLPRPESRQAQGGFPTKLGEYLATGNPVCATTVGEIPDYLVDGESVYFAEPGSVESFANAMYRALSNPQEAKRIGANGRKVAETHFNKDIQAKMLFDFLYKNLSADKTTQ